MKTKDITRALHFDIMRALLFASLLLAMPAIAGAAGHIQPVGVTRTPASQLVVWYDQSVANQPNVDDILGATLVQVTNASTDTSVNIHVQIFADDIFDDTNRCREHDFNDTLTPTDTVQYVIGNLDLADIDPAPAPGDLAPGGNNAGAAIPIDVDQTRGFIVITTVDTVTLPRQAIAFNHLFASVYIFSIDDDPDVLGALAFNAMGREAVDFATGALAANGTVLDGINNGYRVLQPDFLSFGFDDVVTGSDQTHIVSIAFSDNYSDPNDEYRAEPATAVWDPLMFNQFEVGTSCQQHVNFCFETVGLNDDWDSEIDNIPTDDSYEPEPLLCPATDTSGNGNFENDIGWVNIAVSGLSANVNNLGMWGFHDEGDRNWARWMYGD